MATEKTGYEQALELIEECIKNKSTKLELKDLKLESIPSSFCLWAKASSTQMETGYSGNFSISE